MNSDADVTDPNNLDTPSDVPRQRQPDIMQARETLGWQPTIALGDGLMRTIGYFAGLI